jgi:glycosyltransferase involved in cell wall biosynthesis
VQAKPKVVFSQLDHPNILAAFAAHFAGVPRVVVSFRNYNPTNFPYLQNDWFLQAYRLISKSDRVFFSGNHVGANEDYADWIGIARTRVAHIPNAIEREMFATPTDMQVEGLKAELGITPNTLVILGVFRLSAEKDPIAFLEVCSQVALSFPNMRALIIGMGPMQQEMLTRIEELSLGAQVSLLGRRSDVNAFMGLADVFLLASRREGMPNVLMEAQLMALPVVATRAGGTATTVVEGKSALLTDVGDVTGLAAACIKLLSDPALRKAMGQAGLRYIFESFPKKLLGERYLQLVSDSRQVGAAAEDEIEQELKREAAL